MQVPKLIKMLDQIFFIYSKKKLLKLKMSALTISSSNKNCRQMYKDSSFNKYIKMIHSYTKQNI